MGFVGGDFLVSYSLSLDKERDLARGQDSTEDWDDVLSLAGKREGDGVECRDVFLASEDKVPRATLTAMQVSLIFSVMDFSSMVSSGLELRRCNERRLRSFRTASSESSLNKNQITGQSV